MKGPIKVKALPGAVTVTIGAVWAELDRDKAIAMWEELGKQLGMLCEKHSLPQGLKKDHVVEAACCSRCGSLVRIA